MTLIYPADKSKQSAPAAAPVTSGATPTQLCDYNPFAPPHSQDPYPFYAQLRAHAPVHFSKALGAWVVSRYRDVEAILRDPQRFSSAGAVPSMFDNPPEVRAILHACCPEAGSMVNQDPPAHARVRRIAKGAFSQRMLDRLRPEMFTVTERLIDDFIDRGSADLVAEYADRIPRHIICCFLGIPEHEREQVESWMADWMALWTPGVPLERQIEAAHSMPAYERYIAELVAARRRNPQDDAISELARSRDDGIEPLSVPEIIYLVRALRMAGHMTTKDWLASSLFMAMKRPDLADQIRADPTRTLPFIEEVLRFDSPHKGLMRTTTEEVVISGIRIPAGSRVQLLFCSANRDSTVFEDADQFILDRLNIHNHVGFGKGIHACLGAPIAAVEVTIALQTILMRIPDLRLAPNTPIQYLPSNIFRSLLSLHSEWAA